MELLSSVLPFLIFIVLLYFVIRSTTKRSRAAISESLELQKVRT